MSKLLINEHPLQVLPSLAVAIGLQEAIVLQQVHYWLQSSKAKGGKGWVFNTYEQWSEQFPFWSPEAIRKIFKSLRDQGLIVSRPRGIHAFDRVNEYTINYDAVEGLHAEKFTGSCGQNEATEAEEFTGQNRTNLPTTITESTAETTFKRAQRSRAAPSLSLPDWLDLEAWAGYIDMRKRLRKPATDRALALVLRELEKLEASGSPHAEVLDQSTRNGWTDVYALKDKSAQQRPGRQAQRQPTDEEVVAEVMRRQRERGLIFDDEGQQGLIE